MNIFLKVTLVIWILTDLLLQIEVNKERGKSSRAKTKSKSWEEEGTTNRAQGPAEETWKEPVRKNNTTFLSPVFQQSSASAYYCFSDSKSKHWTLSSVLSWKEVFENWRYFIRFYIFLNVFVMINALSARRKLVARSVQEFRAAKHAATDLQTTNVRIAIWTGNAFLKYLIVLTMFSNSEQRNRNAIDRNTSRRNLIVKCKASLFVFWKWLYSRYLFTGYVHDCNFELCTFTFFRTAWDMLVQYTGISVSMWVAHALNPPRMSNIRSCFKCFRRRFTARCESLPRRQTTYTISH